MSNIIIPHFKNIILLFFGILVVGIISFGIILDTHVNDLNEQINNSLKLEKNYFSEIEHLCELVECKSVEILKTKETYIKKNNKLAKTKNYVDEGIELHNALYLVNDELALYSDKAKAYFILNINKLILTYLKAIIIFGPLSLLVFLFPLIKSIKEEKNSSLIMLAGNEAILSNKTMITIAENIHHELNTPLEVIDNKIEKIYRVLNSFIEEEEKYTNNIPTIPKDRIERNKKIKEVMEKDFEFIRTASEQIYTVLEKMKKFKHLRYSNGNKSIRNIIEGGFQIIGISNSNFKYTIDSKLKDYYLKGNIKNAELLSVILNHIKNSLEANASAIHIVLHESSKNKIKIRIIDNGNGIPPKAMKRVFEPNFSTKNIDGVIRGNGMSINKQIMKSAGGDIEVIDSSPKGTTIEVTIPANNKSLTPQSN